MIANRNRIRRVFSDLVVVNGIRACQLRVEILQESLALSRIYTDRQSKSRSSRRDPVPLFHQGEMGYRSAEGSFSLGSMVVTTEAPIYHQIH